MASDGGVASMLAGAKKDLSNAQSFTKSAEGHGGPGMFHQHASAPYSAARQARKSGPAPSEGIKGEAESAAAGIKARAENTAKALSE